MVRAFLQTLFLLSIPIFFTPDRFQKPVRCKKGFPLQSGLNSHPFSQNQIFKTTFTSVCHFDAGEITLHNHFMGFLLRRNDKKVKILANFA
jgi:hypothetical protein